MADDFARLVFQANSASSHDSQYQYAHDGYVPSASPHDSQLLDPFFDDEDEGDPPGSTFPAFTLYKSRRAIYTCPARLRLWLVLHSASKASLQANGTKQGWTFDQDEPPARPPQPPSRNQEGFASKLEVAMGERAGLHRRTGHCLQQSGCKCEFSVKLCFHNEVQHGYLRPQVLIRLALLAQRLARCIQLARFTPFREILQIRQFMCVGKGMVSGAQV